MPIPLTFAAIPIVAVCIGLAAAVLEPVCLATLALALDLTILTLVQTPVTLSPVTLGLALVTVCVATNASHWLRNPSNTPSAHVVVLFAPPPHCS